MAQTKTQKYLRIAGIVVTASLAVSLLGYYLLIRPLQERHERQQFAQAEASLDELEQKIEATIGKPDEIKKEKSCGYASREFEKGPRACSVAIYLIYKDVDASSSTDLMTHSSALFGTKLYALVPAIKELRFLPYSEPISDQSFSQTIDVKLSGEPCSVRYTYPVVPIYSVKFVGLPKENLQLALTCAAPTLNAYFPVK